MKICASLLAAYALGFALPYVAAADDGVQISSQSLSVTVDPDFPRVIAYEPAGHRPLAAARRDRRPTIELNEEVYTPADFSVQSAARRDAVDYTMNFPQLGLVLRWHLAVSGEELHLGLVEVKEAGGFQLESIYFPDHYLVRTPAGDGGSTGYRGEYQREKWSAPVYRGGYQQPRANFFTIRGQDGEAFPLDGNWASASAGSVTATLASNIPYWKIKTQLLGYDGPASDFAMWLGTYHYRLAGIVQPLLQARVAILSKDANADGKVDWMEAALWHRRLFPTPSDTYRPSTFIYKIINAWVPPNNEPLTTFEESLDIIRSVAALTGNAKQIVFLVGWQFEGHDTGYPALDRVNAELGGPERLKWLVAQAKRYNATISYHINLDDAYEASPGFDRSVLAQGRDGNPYPWMVYVPNGPQAYHISHAREVRSGYFQKRAQAFLAAVPVSEAVHMDTFRHSNLSFGPEPSGLTQELVLGCQPIIDWFAERGIRMSSEGPYDGFYGRIEWFLHRAALHDPFHLMMLHGKAYGGGAYSSGVGQTLGWSMNSAYIARPAKPGGVDLSKLAYSPDGAADQYFLGDLTQDVLVHKELIAFETRKVGSKTIATAGQRERLVDLLEHTARFSDGTVSTVSADGHWSVIEGGVPLVDGDQRMLPLGEKEIRLFSAAGGDRSFQLPAGWDGARVTITELGAARGVPVIEQVVKNRRIALKMTAHRAYKVVRSGR